MEAHVTILETNFVVEYDYKITTHGNNGSMPSLNYPGDPPEPCEFDITVLSIKDAKDKELELPDWLKDLIAQHLYERDDIQEVVQQADQDASFGPEDPPDYGDD